MHHSTNKSTMGRKVGPLYKLNRPSQNLPEKFMNFLIIIAALLHNYYVQKIV